MLERNKIMRTSIRSKTLWKGSRYSGDECVDALCQDVGESEGKPRPEMREEIPRGNII